MSLEGNIGSGKSTVLAAVEKKRGTCVLQEPVDEWSTPVDGVPGGPGMLQLFYADRVRNGFAFQMFVMLSRVRQHLDVLRSPGGRDEGPILTERCLASDYELFGKTMRESGLLDDAQWATYDGWSAVVSDIFSAAAPDKAKGAGCRACPAGVVYLRATPEKSLERVDKRRRDGEAAIALEDLASLHEAHEAWIVRLRADGVPVLTLDGDQDGEQAVEAHADAIAVFLASF